MHQGSGGPLRVTYLVRARASDIAARAEALMLEQAVELPRAVAARDPGWPRTSSARSRRSAPPARILPRHHRAAACHHRAPTRRSSSTSSSATPRSNPMSSSRTFTCQPRRSTGCRGPAPASPGSGRSPASPAGPSLATALKPMGLEAGAACGAVRHVRPGRHRPGQGRPRSRRPRVLPVRGPGRGLSPRGGRCGPGHRPPGALRAQPHRHAGPGQRPSSSSRARPAPRRSSCRRCSWGCPCFISWRRSPRVSRSSRIRRLRRRASGGGARAVRQAVPLVWRRRRHLPARGRPVQLQRRDLPPPSPRPCAHEHPRARPALPAPAGRA